MALGTFIAGRYSAAWSASDVGYTAEGYTIEMSYLSEALDKTDAWGDTMIDGVYRGGNCFCQYRSKEYKSGAYGPLVGMGAAIGRVAATATPIGTLLSAMGLAFVLTSTAATPAVATPATLTATLAILAPNYPVSLLYDSRLREVPIRLQFLPALSSGTLTWFTQT